MTRTKHSRISHLIAASFARREWYVGAAAITLLALALTVGVAGAALAQTTTSAPETTTTEGPTTDSTEAATETSTGEAVAGQAFASALLPAPEGFEAANAGMSLDSLELQAWPEYDASEVLIMADLHLADSVELPAEFQVAIPRGARLTGVAEVTPQGQFDYSRPAPTPNLEAGNDEWDVYNLTIPKIRDVRVEYYYNPGISGSGARSFPVLFRVPVDTAQITVAVQQPLRSTEFVITPMPSQSTQDAQGFTYYSDSLGAASEGQVVSLQVDYTKPDAEPSLEGDTDTGAGNSNQTLLLVVLGATVVAIGGFAAYRLFLRPAPASGSARRARNSGGARKGADREKTRQGGPSRYCTSCGAQLGKRDRFCPECGQERD